MRSVLALFFATAATALPAPQAQAALKRFGGLAIRSASPVHLSPIAANGLNFWIGKDTAESCPDVDGVTCPTGTPQTIFSYTDGSGTLALSTSVPGGQAVYVTEGNDGQLAGELRFTQAHSTETAGPALYNGFAVVDGNLQFEGKDWFACPVDDFNTGYGIWAVSRVAGSNAGAGCLGIQIRQAEAGDYQAWQYA